MNNISPSERGSSSPGLHGKPYGDRKASFWRGRSQYLHLLPNGLRDHFVAISAEFAGTFLFLFLALSGTQAANAQAQHKGSMNAVQESTLSQSLYISLGFGFSLAMNIWVFNWISGGFFNPVAALSLALVGVTTWGRCGLLIISHVLGGIAAAGVVSVLFPGPLSVQTSLGGGTTVTQGLFIEMFLTAQLVFTILMLSTEKHKETLVGPIGVGLSLFIAQLTGVYYTGASTNPARSFGPSVVLRSYSHYHWIYWVGPFLGAILASAFYKFIKIIQYETTKRDHDRDVKGNKNLNPGVYASSPEVSFAPAEAPVVPSHPINHPNESLDRFDAGPSSQANTNTVSDSSSSSVRLSSRLSGVGSKGPCYENSVGHIYIDDPTLYTRGTDVEAARYVPRAAGRS